MSNEVRHSLHGTDDILRDSSMRMPRFAMLPTASLLLLLAYFVQSATLAISVAHAATSFVPIRAGFVPISGQSNAKAAPSPASRRDASSGGGGGDSSSDAVADLSDVGFVLLAGGTGSRMKATMPKQYLTLCGRPVLHHSLDLFLERLPAHAERNGVGGPPMVVLVMDPKYQAEYQPIVDRYQGKLAFANPGQERQGSVENGLSKLSELAGDRCTYVAVHDSARPLVTIQEVCSVVNDAKQYGAAVLGVPCKATIKESDDGTLVLRTIPRSRLWEVHTPQVIRIDTLQRGFKKVADEQLEVTDDVSIVEALGEPVKLTLGEYTNLKITTPEDMDVATAILNDRQDEKVTALI